MGHVKRLHLVAVAAAAAQWLGAEAVNYAQPPCQPDETQGEIQGLSGHLCAPRCSESYSCPADIMGLANAQPQCMLQDTSGHALCALICQTDSQCPTGGVCSQMSQMGVGICMFAMSFADWARGSSSQKLAIGWPSSGAPLEYQVTKTQAALQNLKMKFSVTDGDADMAVLQEWLNSMKAPSPGGSPPTYSGAPPPAQGASFQQPRSYNPDAPGTVGHDLNQFAGYADRGLPGFEREFGDTMWNVEHIEHRYAATNLFTGVCWAVVLYVGVGSFLKYNQGHQGMDMVPHIAFWAEYPGLVNDGVKYSKILLGMEAEDSNLSGGLSGGAPPPGGYTSQRGGAGAFEAL